MFAVALRNIIGYAVQILPCAALCLAPFAGRLREGRHTLAQALAIALIGLVPFLLVGCDVLPAPLVGYHLLAQNIVFLVIVCCLLALFARRVNAPIEHKVFVLLLVMCYGAIITQANDALITLLHIDAGSDGYMYPPVKLASLCVVNALLFTPAAMAMRQVGGAIDALENHRLLRRLSVIPAGLLVVLVAVGWLPTAWFSDEQVYWLTLLALFAFAGILFPLVMHAIRDATHERAGRLELEEALEQSERKRQELSLQLSEREAQANFDHRGGAKQTITVSTGAGPLCFTPDEVLYVESLNRSRVIHLADGDTVNLSTPLAKIAESLPTGQFMYCHRSFVVNIDHIRSVSRGGLKLDTGLQLPIGRSHYDEVREAVSRR